MRNQISIYQRANNIWNLVVDKLNKEGKDFAKKDGFKLVLEQAAPELYKIIWENKYEI